MSDALSVRIATNEKVVWEGKASAVSSVNSEGAFDILASHANFMTLVLESPITVTSDGKTQNYSFVKAIIYAHNNKVSVYVAE